MEQPTTHLLLTGPLEQCIRCPQLRKTLSGAGIQTIGELLSVPIAQLESHKGWNGASKSKLSLALETAGKRYPELGETFREYLCPGSARPARSPSAAGTAPGSQGAISLGDIIEDVQTVALLEAEGFRTLASLLEVTPKTIQHSVPPRTWQRICKAALAYAVRHRTKLEPQLVEMMERFFLNKRLTPHKPVASDPRFRELPLEPSLTEFLDSCQLTFVSQLVAKDPAQFSRLIERRHWEALRPVLMRLEVGRQLDREIAHFVAGMEDAMLLNIGGLLAPIMREWPPLTVKEILKLLPAGLKESKRELLDALDRGIEDGLFFEVSDNRITVAENLGLDPEETRLIRRAGLDALECGLEQIDCADSSWRGEFDVLEPEQIDFALASEPRLVRLEPGLYALS